MVQGQNKAGDTAGKPVLVRLSVKERRALERESERVGLSLSTILRQLWRERMTAA